MWYNTKTGACQSIPPWGSAQIPPDLVAEMYPDWVFKEVDFVPPAKVLTKMQKITALNNEYNPQIADINNKIVIAAVATKNMLVEEALRASLVALQAEYTAKKVVIQNGG